MTRKGTKLTDAQKAMRAATRQHNEAIKQEYLSKQKRLEAKLAKVKTFATDTRGNENVRNVAVEIAAKLEDTINRATGLPQTLAEWEAARIVKRRR
jgi:hypothetical protein